MTSRTAVDTSIQLLLALLLVTVHADPTDNGQQNFESKAPQYAQRYKEIVMYLTPTQIRNYEAGHGLPHPSQIPAAYTYEQQKPEQIPINPQEGQIIQNTLDILEANKMQFQHRHLNNADLEYSKSQEQHIDVRPIEEPNTESPLPHPQVSIAPKESEQEQNKLIEQSNNEQDQIAKSYAFLKFFSNQKPENPNKIQVFHPKPNNVNLNEETKLQKEKNFEIQQDTLLRQKYKLIPYEYVARENQEINQQFRGQLAKQENQLAKKENKAQQQLFIPAPPPQQQQQQQQQQNNKEEQFSLNRYVPQQYAPEFSSNIKNVHLEKILQEIQLEREAAKIHAENIAKSPAVVISNDISIIRRRPIEVTRHISIPYPAPFLVPVPTPIEVNIPQPYAVPVQIVRHIPVPVIKTETVEIEKPVPYEVEKHVAEIVEKKVYVPVEKPYTVERFVPVEVKKKVPVEIPVSRPEKFTIIRHVWKH